MKKLLIGGIVTGLALAAPPVAGAQVVRGATYTGSFTTGTPGGTVSVVVSADGTEADFASANWGNNGDCASNSIGRDDMPITNDSFSFFDGGSPVVQIDGFFGQPGVVSGSAQIVGVCNSGLQSWTAETPVVWPDAVLEHAIRGFAGENVYNATGANQVISHKVRRGRAGAFKVHLENEGTEADAIDVAGCGSSKGFRVKYVQAGENVTTQVRSGQYQTATVDTDESETLKLIIKVTRKAKPGRTKTCKVTGSHSGTFRGLVAGQVDAVNAKVKVRRG
jgi:hypothetical protein